MLQTRPDIDAVCDHLLSVWPALDATDEALSLALYHDLALGAPAAPASLAVRLRIPVADVVRRLSGWPGVYYDADGRVVGYWGLSLARTPHRLTVDGRELYTWCAWDTLFLPALLGAGAQVASICRGSGEPVRMTVAPNSVVSADPTGVQVSFLLPDARTLRADLITSFCRYVHFFRSPEVAEPWLNEHPQSFLLTLAEAFEIGRRRNRARYGTRLAGASRSRNSCEFDGRKL